MSEQPWCTVLPQQRYDAFPGRPSAEDVDAIASPFADTMLESLPQGDTRELHRLFPSAGPDAADLLAKCELHAPPQPKLAGS